MVLSSTKYIFSMGELKRKDDSLIFRNENGHTYIPIKGIKELYCMNEVSFNTKFIDFLSKCGIVLHLFNYYGRYSGTFHPREYLMSGKMVIEQAMFFKTNRLDIAKAIVSGTAENIHHVLYHYYRHGKADLKPFLEWLKLDLKPMLEKVTGINQVLYIEGSMWKRFYGSFPLFLNEEFVLNKRVKRPPDNPLNAMISFGNSMLYSKVITQLYHTHLSQEISFLHEPTERRYSLSLDLAEAFKPIIVYKTIFELVNRKMIKVEKHFEQDLNYCILNEAGKKIFVKAIEERLAERFEHSSLKRKTSYFSAIKYDGYKLSKAILEKKDFLPFNIKEKK